MDADDSLKICNPGRQLISRYEIGIDIIKSLINQSRVFVLFLYVQKTINAHIAQDGMVI